MFLEIIQVSERYFKNKFNFEFIRMKLYNVTQVKIFLSILKLTFALNTLD